MPCSPAKARILLKGKKAVVAKRTPFTIWLTIATGETKQPITLGVDAGYKYIGLSASKEKAELYASEVELRQDIPDLSANRSALRQARCGRKSRFRSPRFNTRAQSQKKVCFVQSVENHIRAHFSRIESVCRILPIMKIIVKTAAFDTQRLKNPDIAGEAYRQGKELGFWNVREYVLFRDGHVCQHCRGKSKDPILNVHHLESRRTGGNAPNNRITFSETCHKAYHRGEIELKVKRDKSFKAEAFMGIMRRIVLDRLSAAHPELEVRNTYGCLTKHRRIRHGIATHCADAFCIAGILMRGALGIPTFKSRSAVTPVRFTSCRFSREAFASAIKHHTKSKVFDGSISFLPETRGFHFWTSKLRLL